MVKDCSTNNVYDICMNSALHTNMTTGTKMLMYLIYFILLKFPTSKFCKKSCELVRGDK